MKFSVMGAKAFRDAHDANAEMVKIVRDTGKIPEIEMVEFETTARINAFYKVTKLDLSGEKPVVVDQTYLRTHEEIIEHIGHNGAASWQKIDVFPFMPVAPRTGRAKRAAVDSIHE